MSIFSWFKKEEKPAPIGSNFLICGKELWDKLFAKWPNLNRHKVWFSDKGYILPTKKELEKAIFESPVSGYQYVPEIEDCDDFALLQHADIIRRRYDDYKAGRIPKNKQYPWAFGQIWYVSPQGPHAINVCVSSDKGVLVIEPQNRKIWEPEKDIVISFIKI